MAPKVDAKGGAPHSADAGAQPANTGTFLGQGIAEILTKSRACDDPQRFIVTFLRSPRKSRPYFKVSSSFLQQPVFSYFIDLCIR